MSPRASLPGVDELPVTFEPARPSSCNHLLVNPVVFGDRWRQRISVQTVSVEQLHHCQYTRGNRACPFE